MNSVRYRVYFQPLQDRDSNTYASEIDVSDRILVDGISSIKRSIDSSNYDIGVFVFSDVTLKGYNHNGYFNDQDDTRSIFPSTRDLCKVRIVFEQSMLTRDSAGNIIGDSETQTITFRGLINEEATRLDFVTDTIEFKVLSRDSVIRNTKISGGTVVNGMTVKAAMLAILDVPKITSVLNISAGNINPPNNVTIDVGSKFDNKSVKEMLDKLLMVSNSCMLIEDDGDVIIKDREEITDRPILELFGKSDTYGRENIIDVTSYNTGTQRMFTSVRVNDTEVNNDAFQRTFGYRQKKITIDFITSSLKETEIATALMNEFKAPKIEMNCKVSSEIAKDVQLLDRVSVNYPLRVKPIEGKFLPVVGSSVINDADTPLPYVFGSISVPANFAFKVIEIDENPKQFTSILKLRQVGTTPSDGVFNTPENCIVGWAVVGTAVICVGGNACDQYNPSVVGAAQVGCTLVA